MSHWLARPDAAMASAATTNSSSAPAPTGRRRAPRRSRLQWLILGACVGLGYGVTDRLLNLQITPSWSNNNQPFEVKPFPGTELDTLRRQTGDSATPIRADLDQIEMERRQKREAAELERRRLAMEGRDNQTTDSEIHKDEPPLPEITGGTGNSPSPEIPALPPAAAPTTAPPAAPVELPAAPTTRPPTPTTAAPTP